MNLDDLITELKEINYYQITSQQVESLAAFSFEEYKQLLLKLLEEPVGENSNLKGQEYRNSYKHRVLGCFLTALRPFDDLYKPVLFGALDIADPTSIKQGALALSLLKPVEVIVSDLFEVAEESKNDKELLSHVAWLFYWLGFSIDGSWHQNQILLYIDTNADISLLYNERDQPVSDAVKIASLGERVSKFMLLNYSQKKS